MDIGADYIATGHYARIDKLPNGRYSLKVSETSAKDQTYALYNLTQEQLKRTLMPVELTALCNLLNFVCVGMCEQEKAVTANIPVKTLKYQIACSFKSEE